jgi:hypothetical protein
MSKYTAYALAILLGFFPVYPSSAFDLTGFWTSASGTVYLFAQKDRTVLATYASPNPAQVATGIKPGDIAFVGDVVGQVLSGQLNQRFPLDNRDHCPANWYFTTSQILVVNDDASVMEGPTIVLGQNKQCEGADRAVRLFNLKRSTKP